MNDADASDLLTRLVSIPSFSREEGEASRYLVSWMAERGFDARVDEVGNAVGTRGHGEREILLLGHIDTFPGTVEVRREGNLLYGRGSVDAKGPLCTFAAAASRIDPPPSFRVTVVGAVEEESATSRGARFIAGQRARPHEPWVCVIGEPSHWDRITLGYKGRLLLEVRARFAFSHSAGPELLPAERAVELWRKIESYTEEKNRSLGTERAFETLQSSLREIVTEDCGAYGEARLSLGFRIPVAISPEELEGELKELLGGEEIALDFSGGEFAYRGKKSNRLVRAFLASIRDQGGDPRFVLKTGTADMNVVGPGWAQTPMIAYGPGDSRLDHTPHEHLDLGEYQRSISVLIGVLSRLMDEG